jgi:hypothetical protein
VKGKRGMKEMYWGTGGIQELVVCEGAVDSASCQSLSGNGFRDLSVC